MGRTGTHCKVTQQRAGPRIPAVWEVFVKDEGLEPDHGVRV